MANAAALFVSGKGDSEVQRTMLELLNQLDGFEPSNMIKARTAPHRTTAVQCSASALHCTAVC